jgi:hypothetical protein
METKSNQISKEAIDNNTVCRYDLSPLHNMLSHQTPPKDIANDLSQLIIEYLERTISLYESEGCMPGEVLGISYTLGLLIKAFGEIGEIPITQE